MRSLIVALLALVLVGCAGKVEYVDRPVYITKYRTIEDQYFVKCTIVAPPDVESYMKASAVARESMWVDTYTSQIEHVRVCNQRLMDLKDLNQYLHEQYNEKIETE